VRDRSGACDCAGDNNASATSMRIGVGVGAMIFVFG
jgi:hypothetical protein